MNASSAHTSGRAVQTDRRLRGAGRTMLARLASALAVIMIGGAAAPPARAQTGSAIAGIVKDSSGGVLPGVTIEAASPALIEGTRTTVSDANGQYKIVDLRPGEYAVTFTLTGFRPFKREGILLPASFTASVNAELSVGALAEALTVTGASPLVDVQGSVSQKNMSREVLDTIPTGKDPFAVGQLIPGVTTQVPDVGGTTGMQQPTLQVHGSSNNDNVFMIDGIQIQHVAFSGNQTGFYFNDGLMQEITYQTSALPAEASVGGVQINMIPRDGGNAFHGSFFSTGANDSMQSNNLTPDLVARGLKAQNKVQSVYDVNFALGGPIMKDRLWFFGTVRRWSANNFLANTFTPQGTQALDDNRLTDTTIRLTTQVSKSNKLSVSYDRGWKFRGHRFNNLISANFSDPIADVVQHSYRNFMVQAKWTSTISSHLLFEAGLTVMPVDYNLLFEPGVTSSTIATFDTVKSIVGGASPRQDFDLGTMQTYTSSLSYVSGAHNLKTGFQVRQGWFQESFIMNGDMVQILNNGVPNSVRLYNTPLAHREDLKANLGVYVQDSWTMSHLTLNPGVRFEKMVMRIPAQGAPGGTWFPGRQFDTIDNLVNWNTVSPRFGVSYDLTGDGKTALKGSISRYDRLEGTTLAQNVNPNFIAFSTCAWTSSAPPQPGQIDRSKCTPISGNNNHIDPNMKRPHQWEGTAMIQRQVGANTSVSLGYYGRKFSDIYGIQNLAVPPSSYTPVSITNPLTGQPITVYNQNASTLSAINLLQTTLPFLHQSYNGVEFQVSSRFSKASVFGGFTVGRDYGTADSSLDLNNPNNLINIDGAIGYDSTYQLRAGGSYRLPYEVLIAGSLRSARGLPEARTYTVTRADVPGLTQVTQSVKVAASGAYRLPPQNLLDLRFSRTIKAGGFEIEPTADVFNVLNTNAVTAEVTTVGSSLLTPSGIDFGRLWRLGVHVKF
jgi:hypothetical protein